MTVKWIGAALVLGLSACGGGQTLVKGRIVDHRGAPVAKVEIETVPPTDAVVTNKRGFFVLRQQLDDNGDPAPLKPGTYRLKITKTGFVTQDLEIVIQSGEAKLDAVVLQPKTMDIGDAAPSVTKDPERRPKDVNPPVSGT